MIHHISKTHSLASVFLAQLRDSEVQRSKALFRRNLVRMGEIFAYEISKTLAYEAVETETPLGIATSYLPTDRIVLGTILRAGLPMHQGMLNFFDTAENAFVSTFRKHHKDGSFEINLEYLNCPDINGATVILSDPMLATGSSMVKALEAILATGTPANIHIVAVIASSYGLEYTQRLYPDAHFWIGAEDEELTAKSFIVPGLGDAGDLAFGGKFSEY
jgi:uracil phosphoribosyltransferase